MPAEHGGVSDTTHLVLIIALHSRSGSGELDVLAVGTLITGGRASL
jgi:hypothetical protein